MTAPTPTAARIHGSKDAHWYDVAGNPCHEIAAKTTGKMRPVNLKDARELNLLPSVTSIIKVLHKEALVAWQIEQAVLAVITSPRLPDEPDDKFIERVLQVEQVQEQERDIAAKRGTAIHKALEGYFQGQEVPEELKDFVMPPAEAIAAMGPMAATERVVVGDGYAGMADLILEPMDSWLLLDYKSSKRVPDKGPWLEHRLQLSGYGKAWQEEMIIKAGQSRKIRLANVYISSINPGEFKIYEHDNWEETYFQGFAPLVTYWQWANRYRPEQGIEPIQTQPPTSAYRRSVQELKERMEQQVAGLTAPAAFVAPPAPIAPAPGAPSPTPTPSAPPPPRHAAGKRVVWSAGVPTPSKP